MPDFKVWFKGIDLIILDDLNTIYGSGASFLKEAINYSISNNKGILVSSNSHLDVLYQGLPFIINYDSDTRFNFYSIEETMALSYRKPWSPSLMDEDNTTKLNDLLQYQDNQSAGIVLIYENFDFKTLGTLESQIKKLLPDMKIRIAREPYRNQRVYDLYMHDIDDYELFIIKVENRGEGEQLIHLIENTHDLGAKIIVIAHSDTNFKEQVDANLNSFLNEAYKSRRLDRLRIIFPGYF